MAPRRTASYWVHLGEPPTIAGDRLGAQHFVHKIETLLAEHRGSLTESQQTDIERLHAKWLTRAQGKDAQWTRWGSTPGRRPKADPFVVMLGSIPRTK